MQAEKIVTIIPPDPSLLREQKRRAKKLRVAAYCRVSTDQEEQQSSYEAQIAYYTETIENNSEWVMAGIFADEGISGTDAKKRPEFLKLMELCKRGKVDMILVKSISRFARNTVDCLSYIRMLKEMGVTVVFAKEGINTMEMTSELMISFMSAFAQAESESLSMNVTWGKRRSYQNGKVSFQYSRFYGYEKGEDGQPKIVPEQADVVRWIFQSYLAGQSIKKIKSELEGKGVPSSTGKPEWSVSALQYMLRNEKYIGDAVLQKTYVVDFMTKKSKKNNGEVPKYYITNSHAAIIDRDIYSRVQEEIARRAGKRKVSQKTTRTEHSKYSSKYALSERLVCGECCAYYRRCTWARGGVKKIVWRCINRLEHGTKFCKKSPSVEENQLHDAIIDAFHKLANDSDEVIHTLRESLESAISAGPAADDGAGAQERIKELQANMLELIKSSVGRDMAEQMVEFKVLSDEMQGLQDQLNEQETNHSDKQNRNSRISDMIEVLKLCNIRLAEYDDRLVRLMVERVKVVEDDKVLVEFEPGVEYVCGLG